MSGLYAKRNIMSQGQHYVNHVFAMTGEDLHSKSAIAAELAHRDITIAGLNQLLDLQKARNALHESQIERLHGDSTFVLGRRDAHKSAADTFYRETKANEVEIARLAAEVQRLTHWTREDTDEGHF